MKEVEGVRGIKLLAKGVEQVLAGSRLLVAKEKEDESALKKEVMEDLERLLNRDSRSSEGAF